MPGDYTRFTFRPAKRYSSVVMQQGRVKLDSDWNEQSEIWQHRRRVQTIDVFGRCAVPKATTPDAFRIFDLTPGPPLDLKIGTGRLYVDGLLAEILEGEAFQGVPISYLNQPYLPEPEQIERDGIIYLDVWEREVTYLQDPDLLEKALGGADTTTRLQTLWQVKFLGLENPKCEQELSEHFTSSGGRLTTSAAAPPGSDDPCIIDPAGGFRGLENRLYRVQIHEGGPVGTATFKWSRDNASIVSAVEQINTDRMTVSRIGRDKVLRFSTDDWVEVMDDPRELTGHPGVMARIVRVTESTREIELDRDISGEGFNASEPDRHTRVIRWDQRQDVDLQGLVETSASVELPDGVRLSFSQEGGEFQRGDYWAFHARTADGSVEVLDQAPPRGIVHHYCSLATLSDGKIGEDCRDLWPSGCCCTEVVRVGESIQEAIDSLPPEGGCVCLKPGNHVIGTPIRIRGSNVVLKGESRGVRVIRKNGPTMIEIGRFRRTISDIEVKSIRFRGTVTPEDGDHIALVRQASNVQFAGCDLRVVGGVAFAGLLVQRGFGVKADRCHITDVLTGVLAIPDSSEIEVTGCRLEAGNTRAGSWGQEGIFLDDTFGRCLIQDNLLVNFQTGISLGKSSKRSRIEGNAIWRNEIVVTSDFEERLFAIEVGAPNCAISQNGMNIASELHGGIWIAGEGACVEKNRIQGAPPSGTQVAIAIRVQASSLGSEVPPDHAILADNDIEGNMDGILIEGAHGARVSGNWLRPSDAQPIRFGIGLNQCAGTVLENNRVDNAKSALASVDGDHNQFLSNEISNAGFAISAHQEGGLDVLHNKVRNAVNAGFTGVQLAGTTRLSQNHFENCGFGGFADDQLRAVAVFVYVVLGEFNVESCTVLNTGLSLDNEFNAEVAWGIAGILVLEARIANNLVTYSSLELALDQGILQREHRALVMMGFLEVRSGPLPVGFAAQVLGNKFIGPGLTALVEFLAHQINDEVHLRFERVTFSDNYCWHWVEVDQALGTLYLRCRYGIIMGNHFKALESSINSVKFEGIRGTYVGNIAERGPVDLTLFPDPASNFNHPV